MSRHGRDFDRAQAAYEAKTPYDDEPPMVECPLCHGVGSVDAPEGMNDLVCKGCKGKGEIPKPPKEEREPPQDEWDTRIGYSI